ncbi:MAG: MEMAR_RS02690 family S-layer glycoprotein [Methanoregula sp.]
MTKRLTIALIALVALVLVAVLPVSATYYDINNTIIAPGATVYIGEQQLNFSTPTMLAALAGDNAIGWWGSAAPLLTTSPSQTYTFAQLNLPSVYVSPAAFGNYPGNWYGINATTGKWDNGPAIFTAAVPNIAVDVFDTTTNTVATGGSVIQGDNLTFRINTNLQSAINSPTTRVQDTLNTPAVGNVDIKVHSSTGNTYTALYYGNGLVAFPITKQNVTSPLWFWGTIGGAVPANGPTGNVLEQWNTAAQDSTGQLAYPAGVYTVVAQSRLNGMYDNYLNGGATYTGATVSQPATVTLASNTVSISANVNSVVRSKPFSVTITGKPYMTYHLWVKGTNTMPGNYDNQPPFITSNQNGVTFDPVTTTSMPAPNVPYNPIADNGGYLSQPNIYVWNSVAHGDDIATSGPDSTAIGNGTFEYANVTLDQTGARTVQWTTTNWTDAQQYTIRVEQDFGSQASHNYKYDEVQVQVQQGAVTIVAAGSQSYYLGEEVQFSGTDTETQTVYLFITGPNLAANGADFTIAPAQSSSAVKDGVASTFQAVDVLGDNTWSWEWGTSGVALDAGTYTVYAVSDPDGVNNLPDAYATCSIILKAPFVSATASQSTVANGDPIYITGTAQGQPALGVNIWIMGKNYAYVGSQSVNSDSSFSYEVEGATTATLATGQYFVVVQHPMENGVFDVIAIPAPQDANNGLTSIVYNDNPSQPGDYSNLNNITEDFALSGPNSLQGSNAAEALVEAINSPNVDDTYTKLQFLVETPVITINPIGDHAVGDKFTVTGTTNLAVGDNVLFTIYSSSFQPTDKSASGEFSGASGTVQVTQGTNGLNAVSFDVDASTFKPDEYLVTASSVGLPGPGATGTALFNVLTAVPTTAPVTTVATQPVMTTVPTTIATQPPTQAPTPTKTASPGFGALVAVIGLGAVAFIIVRRN